MLLKAITTPDSSKVVLQPLELQTYPCMKIDKLDVAMDTWKHRYLQDDEVERVGRGGVLGRRFCK